MSRSSGVRIYTRQYWHRLYEQLKRCIASKVFDIAFNAGPSRAHKLLQKALVKCGRDVSVDGTFGEQTLTATNSVQASTLLACIRGEQADFYLGLIAKNPKLATFKNGWLKRAAE